MVSSAYICEWAGTPWERAALRLRSGQVVGPVRSRLWEALRLGSGQARLVVWTARPNTFT